MILELEQKYARQPVVYHLIEIPMHQAPFFCPENTCTDRTRNPAHKGRAQNDRTTAAAQGGGGVSRLTVQGDDADPARRWAGRTMGKKQGRDVRPDHSLSDDSTGG